MSGKNEKSNSPAEKPAEPDSSAPALAIPSAWLVGIGLAIFVLFTSAVYVFGAFGGAAVHRMSEQIGEIIAMRARVLEQAGDVDTAITMFHAALDQRFDDPRQRMWTARELGNLLISEGRDAEAVEVLRRNAAEFPHDMLSHMALTNALRNLERFEELAEAAETWHEDALALGVDFHKALSLYRKGAALEQLSDSDAALQAYLAAAGYNPGSEGAYHAAVLLGRQDRTAEAMALLEAYLPHGEGWRLDSAQRLLETLRSHRE